MMLYPVTHRLIQKFIYPGDPAEVWEVGTLVYIPHGLQWFNCNVFFLNKKRTLAHVPQDKGYRCPRIAVYAKDFFIPFKKWFKPCHSSK